MQVLTETSHFGFPIVTEDGKFKGIVLRNQLLVLLDRKVFVEDPAASGKNNLLYNWTEINKLFLLF